ncbi:MAG: hypothetical protein ACMXYM_05250 [Candidatus Woesearchaeota archaeon]
MVTEHARSPTLDTILMVEETIEKHSGEFSKRGIWQRLPKKVMWQTFCIVIEYLESIDKIAIDDSGTIAYIWNPKLAEKLRRRPAILV